MKKIALLILCCVILLVCNDAESKTIRLYRGEQPPKEKVAVLKVTHHNINMATYLERFDGNRVEYERTLNEYEILPGEHAAVIGFKDRMRRIQATEPVELKFEAKPGHIYAVITSDTGTKGMTWSARIQDVTWESRLTPDNLPAYIKSLNDRLEKQVEDAKENLAQNPNDLKAYIAVGTAYENMAKLDDAVEYYKKALEINNEYPQAYLLLGVALAKKGSLDEALIKMEKADSLMPNDINVLYNLAGLHLVRKEYDKSIVLYNRLIQMRPDNIKLKIALGQAYIVAGRNQDAIDVLKKVLEENPNFPDVKKALEDLYKKQGRL